MYLLYVIGLFASTALRAHLPVFSVRVCALCVGVYYVYVCSCIRIRSASIAASQQYECEIIGQLEDVSLLCSILWVEKHKRPMVLLLETIWCVSL